MDVSSPIAEDDPILNSEVDISLFDWEKWWITSVTKNGHVIYAEAWSAATKDPLKGRPTVYLDQNHWRTVALALLDPARIRRREDLEAALEVVRFATDAGILLPLSSGHMLETGGLYGDRRYEVGATMASLSAGWQLRHPIAVWHQEAAAMLAGLLDCEIPSHAERAVVTLDPNAIFAGDNVERPEDLETTDVELFLLAISSPSILVELLLEPEREQRVPITTWVNHHNRITRQFEQLPGTKEERRSTAVRRFWNENLTIYRREYFALGTSKPWPTPSNKELAALYRTMPMTRLLSDLYIKRFVNKDTQWRENDLVDMLFLSCAAGYADYVVGEGYTGTQLAQTQVSQGMPKTVFTTLPDLVTALHDADVTTDTERKAATQQN